MKFIFKFNQNFLIFMIELFFKYLSFNKRNFYGGFYWALFGEITLMNGCKIELFFGIFEFCFKLSWKVLIFVNHDFDIEI